MRVALVSEHASPLAVLGGVDAGGQNVHVAALAQALARRGAEVVVYTRRDDPSLPRRVRFGRGVWVEHVDAGPPEPLPKDTLLPHIKAFACELERAWRRWRPDVAHAHFWMSARASLAPARRFDVPMLVTFHALGSVKRRHQGAADTSPPERIEIERELVARATGIVATCRDEVHELRRLGAPLERVRIVPCGVDLRLFRPDGPADPPGSRRHRVVVVTRLVERKGVGDVIEALPALDDVELVVAGGPAREELGSDPEARRLLALAAARGVADRVILLGRLSREAVPPLLRSADLVACCPWYEPFGIVPVEAMACGVPVVGSGVGGLLDTVQHGVTGLHVRPRDPADVAGAIRRLLDDSPLRARLGAAAAVRAHAGYGWDRIAAATRSAYRQLARRSDTRRRSLVPLPPQLPGGSRALRAPASAPRARGTLDGTV